jgi:transcriptional regulator with XRE-family HTH domain/tetratricopeptide (TPR) repeat protein
MLAASCSYDLVAQEMRQRWAFRPREAYRHAIGWSQDQVAAQFTEAAARLGNDRGPHSPMIGTRIGEYERWPHGGRRPSTYVLTVLASLYRTSVDRLLDYDDYRHLPDQDRTVLTALLSSGANAAAAAAPAPALSVPPAPIAPMTPTAPASPAPATPAAHRGAAPADHVPVTPVLLSVGTTSHVLPVIPASAIVAATAPPTPAAASPPPAATAPAYPAARAAEPAGHAAAPGLQLVTASAATGHATLTTPPGTTLVTAATSLTPTAALVAAGLEIAPRSGSAARRRRRDQLMDGCTGEASAEEEVIMAAADQSAEFGEWAEATNVGPNTLDQFDQDIRGIARAYLRSAPLPLVLDTIRIRNRAFTLLEGRQHPNQSGRLYVIAGRACGLLAWMSGDVGRTAEAETQARTGWLCAELADHDGLRAWIRATQSKSAYWDGRIRDSVRLAEAGLQHRATDSVRTLLTSLAARAWARLGRAKDAHAALGRAAEERAALAEPDEVGGLYGFSEAQQSYLAGSTYLWLKESAEALRAADRAVWLYEIGAPEERFYGAEMIALIDAATAHLQADELEGAAEKLSPVLRVPPQQRLDTFTQRLGEMRGVLRRSRYVGSRVAVDLQRQIEDFRAGALGQYLSR